MVNFLRRTGHAVLWATALGLCALGCDAHDKEPAAPAAAEVATPARTPSLSTPKALPVVSPQFITATGPATQAQQLDIVALRPGQVIGVDADVDTDVRKGEELAQLEDHQLLADRAAAAYKLQSLRIGVQNREAEVKMRGADMHRAEEMHQSGINTEEDYEHTRFLLEATQLQWQSEQQEVLAAQENLAALDAQLNQTRLLAPFSGVISQRFVRLGQYVNLGDRLFHLVGNSPLEVRFTLPGEDVRFVHRGEKIAVSASPGFEQASPAIVTRMSPVIDPGNGMIELVATLSRPLPSIIPGMIVSVRLPRSHEPG